MDRPLKKLIASALVAALIIPSAITPATATEMDRKAKADAKTALQAYKEGRYEDAAKLFVRLSVDHPEMLVFVRNLGACYYYLHRPEPALSNLRDYLHRQKNITVDDREEVERWIDEMSQERSRNANTPAAAGVAPTATTPPAISPATTAPETPTAAPHTESPVSAAAPTSSATVLRADAPGTPPVPSLSQPAEQPPVVTQSLAEQPHGGNDVAASPPSSTPTLGNITPQISSQAPAAEAASKLVTPSAPDQTTSGIGPAAWILGGVGAAGLVTGTVFAIVAHNKFSQVEDKYDPGEESKGKDYVKFQWIGFGVGVAALTGAAVVALSGPRSPSRVSLAPTIGSGQAGVALGGSF